MPMQMISHSSASQKGEKTKKQKNLISFYKNTRKSPSKYEVYIRHWRNKITNVETKARRVMTLSPREGDLKHSKLD